MPDNENSNPNPSTDGEIKSRVENPPPDNGLGMPTPSVFYPTDGNVLIRTEALDMAISIPWPATEDMFLDRTNYDPEDYIFYFPQFLGHNATVELIQKFERSVQKPNLPFHYCKLWGGRNVKVPTSKGETIIMEMRAFENLPGGLHGMRFEKGKVSHVPWIHGAEKMLAISGDSGIFKREAECRVEELVEQPPKPAWLFSGPPPM